MQCPTSASSADNSSVAPDDSICPGSPTEIFNVDDDNSQMTEEEDDEYFAFAGIGIKNAMDVLFPYICIAENAIPI